MQKSAFSHIQTAREVREEEQSTDSQGGSSDQVPIRRQSFAAEIEEKMASNQYLSPGLDSLANSTRGTSFAARARAAELNAARARRANAALRVEDEIPEVRRVPFRALTLRRRNQGGRWEATRLSDFQLPESDENVFKVPQAQPPSPSPTPTPTVPSLPPHHQDTVTQPLVPSCPQQRLDHDLTGLEEAVKVERDRLRASELTILTTQPKDKLSANSLNLLDALNTPSFDLATNQWDPDLPTANMSERRSEREERPSQQSYGPPTSTRAGGTLPYTDPTIDPNNPPSSLLRRGVPAVFSPSTVRGSVHQQAELTRPGRTERHQQKRKNTDVNLNRLPHTDPEEVLPSRARRASPSRLSQFPEGGYDERMQSYGTRSVVDVRQRQPSAYSSEMRNSFYRAYGPVPPTTYDQQSMLDYQARYGQTSGQPSAYEQQSVYDQSTPYAQHATQGQHIASVSPSQLASSSTQPRPAVRIAPPAVKGTTDRTSLIASSTQPERSSMGRGSQIQSSTYADRVLQLPEATARHEAGRQLRSSRDRPQTATSSSYVRDPQPYTGYNAPNTELDQDELNKKLEEVALASGEGYYPRASTAASLRAALNDPIFDRKPLATESSSATESTVQPSVPTSQRRTRQRTTMANPQGDREILMVSERDFSDNLGSGATSSQYQSDDPFTNSQPSASGGNVSGLPPDFFDPPRVRSGNQYVQSLVPPGPPTQKQKDAKILDWFHAPNAALGHLKGVVPDEKLEFLSRDQRDQVRTKPTRGVGPSDSSPTHGDPSPKEKSKTPKPIGYGRPGSGTAPGVPSTLANVRSIHDKAELKKSGEEYLAQERELLDEVAIGAFANLRDELFSHPRDHFSRTGPAPPHAIDHGPNGNRSLLDPVWPHNGPFRTGRDPRHGHEGRHYDDPSQGSSHTRRHHGPHYDDPSQGGSQGSNLSRRHYGGRSHYEEPSHGGSQGSSYSRRHHEGLSLFDDLSQGASQVSIHPRRHYEGQSLHDEPSQGMSQGNPSPGMSQGNSRPRRHHEVRSLYDDQNQEVQGSSHPRRHHDVRSLYDDPNQEVQGSSHPRRHREGRSRHDDTSQGASRRWGMN